MSETARAGHVTAKGDGPPVTCLCACVVSDDGVEIVQACDTHRRWFEVEMVLLVQPLRELLGLDEDANIFAAVRTLKDEHDNERMLVESATRLASSEGDEKSRAHAQMLEAYGDRSTMAAQLDAAQEETERLRKRVNTMASELDDVRGKLFERIRNDGVSAPRRLAERLRRRLVAVKAAWESTS